MVRIYTKGGDGGETSLFDGARVLKSHERVAAYGDVDELNAALGLARAHLSGDGRLADLDSALESIQRDLFALGAILADPRRDADATGAAWTTQVAFDADRATALEPVIDRWEEELEPLTAFVLPGGTLAAGALHVARTVARRAERNVVALVAGGAATAASVVYLNRVSDLLFVAARLANHRAGVPDVPWRSGSR